MSQEVGSSTSTVSSVSGGVSGRKSGRAALNDSDLAGSLGGFGAIFANLDRGSREIEDAAKARDRNRKSSDPSENSSAPTECHPEKSQFSGPVVLAEAPSKDISEEDELTSTQDVQHLSGLTDRGSNGDGIAVVGVDEPISGSVDISSLKDIQSFEVVGLPSDVVGADVGSGLPNEDLANLLSPLPPLGGLPNERVASFAAKGAQEAALAAAKSSNLNAAPGAGSSSLVSSRMQGRLAGANTKLLQDKSVDELTHGSEGIYAMGTGKRTDDGGFRTRVAQEIKLLTQQASLTREVADPQQHPVQELELFRYGRTTTELSLAPLAAKSDPSGQSTEIVAPSDSAGSGTAAAGFLATATDMESNDSYWISGDLKNAKMQLGDASEGVVEVSISLQGNQAQVAFRADEISTRNALQDSGSELKEMLRRDGIELAGVSVGSSGAGDSGSGRDSSGSENRRTNRQNEASTGADDLRLADLPGDARGLDLFV